VKGRGSRNNGVPHTSRMGKMLGNRNHIMSEITSILIFFVTMFIGYKLISNVPSLLHTPLMSGMNALSGITILGALTATAMSVGFGSKVMGIVAIFLAMLNIAGGFGVTHRMLRMFKAGKGKK